jgi:pSer/pThr/pTyr-binding forkhead associated (FHA) protein
MALLIMRRGPEPGKVYTLTEHIVQIGRGAKNEIILNDNEVSRDHCRLVLQGELYELIDLDSSNGTYVNGQRVHDPWILNTECIIELGDSITFEYRPYNESTTLNTIESEIATNDQTFLVVTVTSQANPAIYPLEGEQVDVGRGTANKVIIIEPEVSRHHLRLTKDVLGYKIEDMNTTNGTTLNGTPLKEQHILRPGDVMRIGTNVVILYTNDPDPFLPKKGTASLEDRAETREIQRRQRKTRTGSLPMLDNLSTSEVGTGV